MTKVHELKTWPVYFDAVKTGEKTYEVRQNDRFFQTGDYVKLLRMRENSFGSGYDTFEKPLLFKIGAVLQGGQFGIAPSYCVFSLLPVDGGDDAQS